MNKLLIVSLFLVAAVSGHCTIEKIKECVDAAVKCGHKCDCLPVICDCCAKCIECVAQTAVDCCDCLFPHWSGCHNSTAFY